MSTDVGKERSSIKPEMHPQHSKRELKFSYSTAEYDSCAKNGFVLPADYHRSDIFERKFIMAADPEKGPIKVKINNIVIGCTKYVYRYYGPEHQWYNRILKLMKSSKKDLVPVLTASILKS